MGLLSASTLFFLSSHYQLALFRHASPLSQQAWRASTEIIQKIKKHPFNQALMDGTLPHDKFAYYIEQDVHYLKVYSQVNRIIASRITPQYAATFLKSSHYAANDEQTVVHEFLKYQLHLPRTGLIAPATQRYNHYLMRVAKHEPVAVAVAAILPCQWIYFEVGTMMANHAKPNNPYAPWFNTYSSKASQDAAQATIRIFDALASTETDEIRQKMIEAFKKSSQLELDFWDDAYHKKTEIKGQRQTAEIDKYPQPITEEADALQHN